MKRRHVDLAVLVDANADRTLGLVVLRPVVGLELDPRAAVRNDRRVVRRARVGVDVLAVVHAGRTHELAHDHALRAVDHERALVGHEREIAHENFLVGDAFDFAGLGRDQADAHAQRRAVGHIAFAAFLDRILRLAERVLAELENQVAGEVFDRRDRGKRFRKAFGLEPIEAGLLQLDQIRNLEDVRNLRKRVSRALGPGIGRLLDRKRSRRERERLVHGSRRHAGICGRTFRAFRLALTRRGALRGRFRCRRFRHYLSLTDL